MNTPIQQTVIDRLTEGLLPHLHTIGIVKGADKKARDYAHVFVPGDLYGGKMGRILCGKGWKEKHAYRRGYIEKDICPQCRKLLAELAAVASEKHASRLHALASSTAHDTFTAEEVGEILIIHRRRQGLAAKIKQDKPMLFSADEVNIPVRRTQVCEVPFPSSTSAATNPSA